MGYDLNSNPAFETEAEAKKFAEENGILTEWTRDESYSDQYTKEPKRHTVTYTNIGRAGVTWVIIDANRITDAERIKRDNARRNATDFNAGSSFPTRPLDTLTDAELDVEFARRAAVRNASGQPATPDGANGVSGATTQPVLSNPGPSVITDKANVPTDTNV